MIQIRIDSDRHGGISEPADKLRDGLNQRFPAQVNIGTDRVIRKIIPA